MSAKHSVGERPAFPGPAAPSSGPGSEHHQPGMTYRQWLVGMAVANGAIGMQAIEIAENVIKMLDKE